MIRIEGIAAFVAVVEAGSVSEAARRLRLSKSVVSERLAELEKSLGGMLLHRTTRKLTLTEDGTVFLERAARIVREIEEAAADMAERRGTLSGPIRIAAPVTFGRMHLGPALYPFLAEHPEIELTLDIDDRRVDAASDGYDAIIRNGPIADSRLVAWKLAHSRRLLCASPDYLARQGIPSSLSDLNSHRGIFYTNRGVADWRFQTPDGAIVVRAKLALGINNGDMLRDAAIAGLGIALLPAFIAGPAIREGRLAEVDVGHRPEAEFIYMAHPEGRNPSAKLRAIADHLKTSFGDPPYWDPVG
ncbi:MULTISPECIES: LysR family transcriptional regulator [Rhizobium]|jgi:DNA-binding transcriptional LysR family regulator|uniref:LysR family transcriptional regulator n=1 Tax=Rhizobium TaxID=379 RepID=UPI0010402937|nr:MULTISPECIES: LysR family transcriptional regulator [Rhizobium]KAF5882026.1 LysR family transcriptional regulator [Rhizobium sp. PEPV16]MBY3155068.1 LysR family transcriptional regulator [Rhizobium laguerreae]MBY5749652.1 LysR family transcriptional regulator [Rhizobium leguminosarum]MBY5769704.1 LysR family transcriptional regulator [Rhizobium leguminosarum]MBY5825413.1 LysR family transcriptional regulator [Rhizobium leguminosarum]